MLEPKKGLYDTHVLVLDFQSLYPSIIQEYNICYTTVKRHFTEEDEGSSIELPPPISHDEDFAVLPAVIARIVQSRREVKGLMGRENNPGRKKQYDLRQLALKLTANSMYGCLGFAQSRFFAEPIAALITSQGRKILQHTVDIASGKCDLDVIYGDTDSIMVNTKSHNLIESRSLGWKLIRFVNKEYRKLVLEEDYIFRSMLLLKKKKYAAMKVVNGPNKTSTYKLEMKGIDIVRRDWAPIVKDLGKQTLEALLDVDGDLEERVGEIHDGLRRIRMDMIENDVPMSKYVITKQLTKAIEEYPDAKHQPHVMVAKRRAEAGKRDGTKAGETVPYIIALQSDATLEEIAGGKGGGSGGKGLAERAYHPEEIVEMGLKVDLHYYLSQQIHPVISRLCAPIEQTDGAMMAECLGLDSNKFKSQARGADDDFDDTFGGGAFAMDDDEHAVNDTDRDDADRDQITVKQPTRFENARRLPCTLDQFSSSEDERDAADTENAARRASPTTLSSPPSDSHLKRQMSANKPLRLTVAVAKLVVLGRSQRDAIEALKHVDGNDVAAANEWLDRRDAAMASQ